MTNTSTYPSTRLIVLQGPVNFRDLGGYESHLGGSLRWRQLFRSDGLDCLTSADRAVLLEELTLASVIDLRAAEELQTNGCVALDLPSLAFHHVPIVDETRSMIVQSLAGVSLAESYLVMLEQARERLVSALRLIARADAPMVFHCAAGKDRTGLVAALVLSLLGVSDHDIADDYAASAAAIPALRARWDAKLRDLPEDHELRVRYAGYEAAAAEMLSARPTTMLTVLSALNAQYDSVAGWAFEHGLSQGDAQRLRSRLLV